MLGEIYQAVFYMAGLFCHQIPERSFFICGVQFPLCIRCTSLLAGAFAAVIYITARRPLPAVRLSMMLALPMAIELCLVTLGVVETGNTLRSVASLTFGFFFFIGTLEWMAAHGP